MAAGWLDVNENTEDEVVGEKPFSVLSYPIISESSGSGSSLNAPAIFQRVFWFMFFYKSRSK